MTFKLFLVRLPSSVLASTSQLTALLAAAAEPAIDVLARLSRDVERLQRQVASKAKTLSCTRDDLTNSRQHCAEIERELEQKEKALREAESNADQYRLWWMNEIQFTKLICTMRPGPDRDMELTRASQAHYLAKF